MTAAELKAATSRPPGLARRSHRDVAGSAGRLGWRARDGAGPRDARRRLGPRLSPSSRRGSVQRALLVHARRAAACRRFRSTRSGSRSSSELLGRDRHRASRVLSCPTRRTCDRGRVRAAPGDAAARRQWLDADTPGRVVLVSLDGMGTRLFLDDPVADELLSLKALRARGVMADGLDLAHAEHHGQHARGPLDGRLG